MAATAATRDGRARSEPVVFYLFLIFGRMMTNGQHTLRITLKLSRTGSVLLGFMTSVLGALILSCGSNGGNSNQKPPNEQSSYTSPQTEEQNSNPSLTNRNYWLRESNCDTGKHNFSGTDPEKVLKDYCAALIDNQENKSCAEETRLNLFKSDCLEIASYFTQVVISEDGSINLSQPASRNLKSITDPHHVEQELSRLWVEKATITLNRQSLPKILTDDDPSTENANQNLDDNALEDRLEYQETVQLVGAAKDCGINFRGPLCLNYLKQTSTITSGITVNKTTREKSYFQVLLYPRFSSRILLVFPLNDKNNSLGTEEVNVFLISPEATLNQISKPDLSRKIFIPAAKLAVSQLSDQRIYQISEASSNVRQLLALTQVLVSSHISDEHTSPKNSVGLTRFISERYQTLLEKKDLLNEETDFEQISDYFILLFELFRGDEKIYQNDLLKLAKSTNPQVVIESSLRLAFYFPKEPSFRKNLSLALVNDNTLTLLAAIQTIKNQPLIIPSLGDRQRLVRLLLNTSILVSNAAYDLLSQIGIDSDLLPPLISLSSRKNLTDATRLQVFNLLSKIDNTDAKTSAILTLSGFSQDFRADYLELVTSKIDMIDLNDNQLSALINLLSHKRIALRMRAITWLVKINTPAAKLALINHMDNDLFTVRRFISDQLRNLVLDESFIPILLQQWNKGYDDVTLSVIQILSQTKSDTATSALIEKMSVFEQVFRDEINAALSGVKLNDEHAKKLSPQVNSEFSDTRNSAVNLLENLISDESTKSLINNMGSDDVLIRNRIIAILKQRAVNATHVPSLTKALGARYLLTISTAIQLLGKIDTDESFKKIAPYICVVNSDIRNEIIHQLDSHKAFYSIASIIEPYLLAVNCPLVSVQQFIIEYINRFYPDSLGSDEFINLLTRFEYRELSDETRQIIMNLLDSKEISEGSNYTLVMGIQNADNQDIQIFLTKLFAKMLNVPTEKGIKSIEENDHTQGNLMSIVNSTKFDAVRELADQMLNSVKLKFTYFTQMYALPLVNNSDPNKKILGINYCRNMITSAAAAAKDQKVADDMQLFILDITKALKSESDPEIKKQLNGLIDEMTKLIADMRTRLPKKSR